MNGQPQPSDKPDGWPILKSFALDDLLLGGIVINFILNRMITYDKKYKYVSESLCRETDSYHPIIYNYWYMVSCWILRSDLVPNTGSDSHMGPR